ncbi:hypothetical protein [Pedobacter nototheniae]|uniref:hypothetical protein n=1 Tax=Pedobacter nototheniae TaxID=2488994 RepID=UPI00292E44F5|nr:hypothetical protein [Pedobacter nototheniae]
MPYEKLKRVIIEIANSKTIKYSFASAAPIFGRMALYKSFKGYIERKKTSGYNINIDLLESFLLRK